MHLLFLNLISLLLLGLEFGDESESILVSFALGFLISNEQMLQLQVIIIGCLAYRLKFLLPCLIFLDLEGKFFFGRG